LGDWASSPLLSLLLPSFGSLIGSCGFPLKNTASQMLANIGGCSLHQSCQNSLASSSF
jgi:hypothetical protein